jgi:hypothetical protein
MTVRHRLLPVLPNDAGGADAVTVSAALSSTNVNLGFFHHRKILARMFFLILA